MRTKIKIINLTILSILGLAALIVSSQLAYSGYSLTGVSEMSLSEITQVTTPSAYGGHDIVTYVSAKTIFSGYGSSKDGNVIKYEWDFDGDGVYDWESEKSGLSHHKYRSSGLYEAMLRVTDSYGNYSIDIVEVMVETRYEKQRVTGINGPLDSLAKEMLMSSEAEQMTVGSDGEEKKFVIMINGGSESRYWDDVTFMYSTLIDDYQFTPESIYLFNYNGKNPSNENPDNMIDYAARTINIDLVFTELENIMDADDELFIWITGHGRGYHGPESMYYGYLDGYASVDPGDEEDYLESEFKLRSFYNGGNYKSDHGMDVWKVYYSYYASGDYRMWRRKYVSSFNEIYFEDIGASRSDGDVFIERLIDYLAGDYNRNGIIETSLGEVYDYDEDGIAPYNQYTDIFDEDDWGSVDKYNDDETYLSTQVPGDSYIIFDANLDNHLDIDIDYDINNLEVDGTDLDNEGLFDGIDINSDHDMNDWVSIDEMIQLYADKLSDDDLAVYLNRLNARAISIVAEPCFSGGLVEDLSGPNRVISTVTEEETLSYGNVFIRNFTSAFHGVDLWGAPVYADANGDGLISMLEAFNYASLNDPYSEVPQYDDNGDGISNPYPVPGGGDGYLGATVYLDIVDNDGDGYAIGVDCNDNDPAVNPGAVEDCTDGIDNDCDSLTDAADPDAVNCLSTCVDSDSDGYGNPGDLTCFNGPATDCNDNNPDINPGASDDNCDDVDDNCSGTSDDEYSASATGCGVGACTASGQLECQFGVEVDSCVPGNPHPEICDNSIDENCDGQDDICPQGDLVTITTAQWDGGRQKLSVRAKSSENGYASLTVTYGSESYPMTYKTGKNRFELKLQSVPYYPIVDVASSLGGSSRSGTLGGDCNDNDIDGYGSGDDCLGADCNDSDAAVNPDATEICGNGIDENCDGQDDICTNNCTDIDGDEYGAGADCLGPDCDDTDPAINPDTYWFRDFDGDSFGNPVMSLQQCDQPIGFVLDNTDCDDNAANIYPGGLPVRISGTTPVYYSSLQIAYNGVADGGILQAKATVISEDINFNLDKSVTIEGGYDCSYSINSGITTNNGTLTINEGIVIFSNFRTQ